MINSNRQKGFTLIELLAVALIIGVLVSIAIPSYQNHVRKTRMDGARADIIENIRKMEEFYHRNKSFAEFNSSDLTQNNSRDYFTFALNASDNEYKITATPTAKNAGEKRTAIYDSIKGMFLCVKDTDCVPF